MCESGVLIIILTSQILCTGWAANRCEDEPIRCGSTLFCQQLLCFWHCQSRPKHFVLVICEKENDVRLKPKRWSWGRYHWKRCYRRWGWRWCWGRWEFPNVTARRGWTTSAMWRNGVCSYPAQLCGIIMVRPTRTFWISSAVTTATACIRLLRRANGCGFVHDAPVDSVELGWACCSKSSHHVQRYHSCSCQHGGVRNWYLGIYDLC